MAEKITVNVIATTDSAASVAIGSMALLNSLIQELQNQGILTKEAVGDIYDRAIDALTPVDSENPTDTQRLSSQAAAFLRSLAPGA